MELVPSKVFWISVAAVLTGFFIQTFVLYGLESTTGSKKKLLTLGILSARDHFEERESLRKTWLQSMSVLKSKNVQWIYKFIVGDKSCNIPWQNRKDIYSCERIESLNLTGDIGDISLFSSQIGTDISSRPVWNISIAIHHPVIVKQLGLAEAFKLSEFPVTVMLYDEFREEIVTSVSFSVHDAGHMKSGYRYQPVNGVLLPNGFLGTLKVTGTRIRFQNLEDVYLSVHTVSNCKGLLGVEYLDEHGYPSYLNQISGTYILPMSSLYISVSDQNSLKARLSQQMTFDKTYTKEQSIITEKLNEEISREGDVLLVDVVDVYRNLPRKVLKFHEWVNSNFDSEFVMKTDDDCFVDVESVVSEVKKFEGGKLWLGNFRHEWFVERSGKWAEPLYRAQEYPAFACGSGNIVSKAISSWIAVNSKYLHTYQGEDTSMGIWLSAVGPLHVSNDRWKCENTCEDGALVIPELSVGEMYSIWENKQKCGQLCGCGV